MSGAGPSRTAAPPPARPALQLQLCVHARPGGHPPGPVPQDAGLRGQHAEEEGGLGAERAVGGQGRGAPRAKASRGNFL